MFNRAQHHLERKSDSSRTEEMRCIRKHEHRSMWTHTPRPSTMRAMRPCRLLSAASALEMVVKVQTTAAAGSA